MSEVALKRVSGIPSGCLVVEFRLPGVFAALRPPATFCDPYGIRRPAAIDLPGTPEEPLRLALEDSSDHANRP